MAEELDVPTTGAEVVCGGVVLPTELEWSATGVEVVWLSTELGTMLGTEAEEVGYGGTGRVKLPTVMEDALLVERLLAELEDSGVG